jgi:hypothetical protein
MESEQFEILVETFKKQVNLAAPTPFEKSIKGKSDGCNINQYALVDLHLSTNLAIIEQSIVELVTDFPLSCFDMLNVPCDKEEL